MSSGIFGRAVRTLWNGVGLPWGHHSPVPVFWDTCPPGYATLFRSMPFRTIIDVGAHVGEFSILAHYALPQASVLAFEPLENAFKALDPMVRSFGGMSAAYPFALGDTAGECAMFEEAFTPCSSLLPLAPGARRFFPYLLWKKGFTVRQRTLDDVLADRSFERPALLKIDVQGMEDRVLKGASRVLHDIDVILVETSFVHINEGQLLFPEMRSLIESYGFHYQGPALQWKSFFGGRIIQEDSVFVR